jgi:hypothetical protein
MTLWQDHMKEKVMFEIFFNWKSIMHDFIPDGAMVK